MYQTLSENHWSRLDSCVKSGQFGDVSALSLIDVSLIAEWVLVLFRSLFIEQRHTTSQANCDMGHSSMDSREAIEPSWAFVINGRPICGDHLKFRDHR